MDTDELSNETYKAILITSEKFNHNLTLQFGLLSYDCTDDNDYLKKANQLINDWKADLENNIDEIFFDTKKPTPSGFEKILSKIQNQIEKVLNIPIEKREFDF
jgi:hypothetical protein